MRSLRYALLILSLLLPAIGHATDRYVSPSGSGSSCSSDSPCEVHTAIAQMGAGDITYFYGGTYATTINSSDVHFPTGNNWNDAPQFKAVSGQTPIIQPISGSQVQAIALVSFQQESNYLIQYVIFDGLILDGDKIGGVPGASATGGMQFNGARHIRFMNGEVRNFYYGSGIEFSRSQGPSDFHEIINVKIYRNGINDCCGGSGNVDHGVYGSAADTLYDHVEVFENGHIGIQLYNASGGTDNITIQNSSFHDNGQVSSVNPIELWVRGSNNIIKNTIFYSSRGECLALSNASNAQLYNNTYYNCSIGVSSSNSSADMRNNILYQVGNYPYLDYGGSSITESTSLSSDPGFVSVTTGGVDFHLTTGSPAINAAPRIASVTTDREGTPRSDPTAIGAYEFGGAAGCNPSSCPNGCCGTTCCPPNPEPVNLVAEYKMEQGTGTTVLDTSGHGHTGTMNTAGWGTGIIDTFSALFNGARQITVTNSTPLSPNSFSISAWEAMSTTASGGCSLLDLSGGFGFFIYPDGHASCFFAGNTGNKEVGSSTINVLAGGTPHHLACTYDRTAPGPGLRLYVDNVQVAFTSTADTITYGNGYNLTMGQNPTYGATSACTGRLDNVRIYQGQLDQAAIQNLYNEQVTVMGTTHTHQQWARANATQTDANLISMLDGNVQVSLGQSIDLITTLTRAGASTTKYYPLYCRVNGGAAVKVGNSLGSLGLNITTNTVLPMGTNTVVPLPSTNFPAGGLNAVAGRVVSNTINATQRTTLANGDYTQWRYTVGTGPPLTGTESIQCAPYDETDVPLDGGYQNLTTLTFQGLVPPAALRLGGLLKGGRWW